jgi:hypothetical protein
LRETLNGAPALPTQLLAVVVLLFLVASEGRYGATNWPPAACSSSASSSSVGPESPIATRARSIQPSELTASRADRYRVDEQRNVISELRDHPITGLGVSVPWSAREPLAEEHDRNYIHVVLLWYWLKLGILGVITYLWLMAMAVWTAFMVWRQHPDGLIRAAGLAAVGGLVALVIVELTASFVGIEPRITAAFGALLGWIGAAWHQLPEARRARAAAATATSPAAGFGGGPEGLGPPAAAPR